MSFINNPLGTQRTYRLLQRESDLYKTLQGYITAAPQHLLLTPFYLTRVQLSSDGAMAKIFFLPRILSPPSSITRPEMLLRFKKATHAITTAIKAKMALRRMPHLTFLYDQEGASTLKLEKILDTL